MKYALAFALMSVMLTFIAFSNKGLAFILLWLALGFALISIAYLGLGVKIFGKNNNGKVGILYKLTLFPFLLFTYSVWHFYRLFIREDAYNKINDNITVGRKLLSSEIDFDYDHYIDLTAEFEDPARVRSVTGYLAFPILDASTPSEVELTSMIKSLSQGRVYIHCAQGHGRTGLFAIALLFHRGQISTVDEALTVLQKHRPSISLNKNQYHFIESYITNLQSN